LKIVRADSNLNLTESPSMLNSKVAGTTGITGISLVVKYAEPFFYKCLFLSIHVFSRVPRSSFCSSVQLGRSRGFAHLLFGATPVFSAALPIAAYVCVAYSSYEHRQLPLAGLSVCLSGALSSLVIHPSSSFLGMRAPPCSLRRGQYTFSFVPAFSNKPGIIHSILL